ALAHQRRRVVHIGKRERIGVGHHRIVEHGAIVAGFRAGWNPRRTTCWYVQWRRGAKSSWRKRVSADDIDIADVIAEISSYPRFYPLSASPVGATKFRESIARAVRHSSELKLVLDEALQIASRAIERRSFQGRKLPPW